jgi:hypothetical protein
MAFGGAGFVRQRSPGIHPRVFGRNARCSAHKRHIYPHALQQAGLIKHSRGRIQILDVDGLHERACECYETVRSQYAKLLGSEPEGT